MDWCKRQLEAGGGEDVRALVVNAGCANSFTGKPGADAARRVASAVAKRLDCRQRDVMLASTGVIGVLLDDAKITAACRRSRRRWPPTTGPSAAQAIMTTDTFPKGAYAEAEIDGVKVQDRRHRQGLGHDRAGHGHHAGLHRHRRRPSSPAALQTLVSLYTRSHLQRGDGGRRPVDQRHLPAVRHRPGRARPGSAAPAIARLADFRDKLEGVMLDLAQQLVRDGEGATKFVKITVNGAEIASLGAQDRPHGRRRARW